MKRTPLLLLLAVAVSGCQQSPSWYHDVKPIVDGRCVSCHVEGGIAPFSLTSYETAQPMAKAVANAVKNRTMPPWHASAGDVEFQDNPSLTDEQINTIVEWANTGATEGDPKAKVTPLPPIGAALSRVDRVLTMTQPYSPKTDPDEYRCFPLDWPETSVKYMTGFEAAPGNNKIVHHVALFAIDADHASLPAQWDADEPGDGYTCFGGPAGNHPVDFPIILLGGWTPGTNALSLPEGLGFELKPGMKLVLQLHYNHPVGQTDQTAIHLRLEDQVQHVAYYLPFLKLDWTLGQMKIPAGENPVVHRVIEDPRNFFSLVSGNTVNLANGFDIYAAWPHMHQLGVQTNTTLVHEDKSKTVLVKVDDWDFHWQRSYMFTKPVPFVPGDKFDLSCSFDNSQAKQPYVNGVQQPPHDVNWGEGSGDEMCESTVLVVPK